MATNDNDFTPVTAWHTPALCSTALLASSVAKSTLNDQQLPAKSVLKTSIVSKSTTTQIDPTVDPTLGIPDWKIISCRAEYRLPKTTTTHATQCTFDITTAFHGLATKLLQDDDKATCVCIQCLKDDVEYLTSASTLPSGKQIKDYAQVNQGPHDNNQAQMFMLLCVGVPVTTLFAELKSGMLEYLQEMNIWFVEHVLLLLSIKSIGYLTLKQVKEVNTSNLKTTDNFQSSLKLVLPLISFNGLSPSQIAVVKSAQADTKFWIPFELQAQKVFAYSPKDALSNDPPQGQKSPFLLMYSCSAVLQIMTYFYAHYWQP